MGWNSWNSGIPLTEQTVTATVDAMVDSGMRDAGYRYVNLDAGWAAARRGADGRLQADPQRFPHGIAELARYAHDRGLELGLYASPFDEICGQAPAIGSAGHEDTDARTFAEWGVDYLKYDWCRADANHPEQVKYFTAMRDALRHSGRRIVYSINPNSSADLTAGMRFDWSQIAELSRNTMDLVPAWSDAAMWSRGLAGVREEFGAAAPVADRSGPGHWNDPDMLVVGLGWGEFAAAHPGMLSGLGAPGTVALDELEKPDLTAQLVARVAAQRPDLTEAEQQAHFSLWALLAAPLLAGNDIRSMSAQTRDILTNHDVIAVDQDPLGVQGAPLPGDGRVIVKRLSDGSAAVALLNADAPPRVITTDAHTVGLPDDPCYRVRDLWSHTDSTTAGPIVPATIPAHGVAMFRVTAGCPASS